MHPLQNIVNQKKQAEEEVQQALDAGKPTKASGVPQPAAPAPVGEKRRNRWDQSAPTECVVLRTHCLSSIPDCKGMTRD